ncbi:MAG: hypothetical protein ACRCYX_00520, partial [Dermatophilaceae bacterium]
LRAGAATARFSQAKSDAAANLLAKAHRALHAADDDRARAMVERAVALPYDEHEESAPAAWMVHLEMFTAIADSAESDLDGEDWLDAALDTLASAPGEARFVIRDCLVDIAQDYHLTGREQQRLRAAVADVPERAELRDLDLPPGQLTAAVLEVLRGVIHYEDAYRRLIGDAQD